MTAENTCRCPWLDTTKLDYVKYHDEEWGVPVLDDDKMFEYLVLESAQAGLSWYTILKRRDGYRKAFANFDVNKVALFTLADEQRLVLDASIIRHQGKLPPPLITLNVLLPYKRNLVVLLTTFGHLSITRYKSVIYSN
ncbi:DNA-3-methyladenine glycosylase I [Colwellia marinimaniae]|uniref:DNA-3-methyladenine glycosylase I n=1 Tax=Colwellia marinimaniae TaxID=1513592 RepID=A0ABQ0MX22_9GAMM|nr:DNA-3-methyladenine glycosylase I [Colwellia marinimaniae]